MIGFIFKPERLKLIVDGFKASEEELDKLKGPYIQNKEEVLSFDTTEMNNLLCSFLNKMIEDYLK